MDPSEEHVRNSDEGGKSMNVKRANTQPPAPVHLAGMEKGEEYSLSHGKEAGRGGRQYRSSRDSTSINPQARKPIHPAMPSLPPA